MHTYFTCYKCSIRLQTRVAVLLECIIKRLPYYNKLSFSTTNREEFLSNTSKYLLSIIIELCIYTYVSKDESITFRYSM